MNIINKQLNKQRRRGRSRSKISGTNERPRISINASLRGMFAQLIDDEKGATIVSSSDRKIPGTKTERSIALGEKIAELAIKKGIKACVLDRGSKKYHGRIKFFADALRDKGITI